MVTVMDADDAAAAMDQQHQEEVQLPVPHLPEEAVAPAADTVAAVVDGEVVEVEAQQLETQAHAEAQLEVAAEAPALPPAPAATSVLEENMKKLRRQQVEQTQLIVNMQAMINDLSAKQNELEEEIQGLKGGRWIVKAEPATTTTTKRGTKSKDGLSPAQVAVLSASTGTHTGPSAALASGIDGATTDDDIDAIVRSRKERKLWPLKRKYATCFTQEFDLLRLRFHRSDKYSHKSVRIPKVDKNEGYGLGNKEGRLICRLCSGKTINRNTSWMCSTCLVPLCVDIVNGDPESSCHARWHGCQDLVAVNATLNTALKERRESKKRSRDSNASFHQAHPQVMESEENVAAAKQPTTDAGETNMMEEIHQHEAVAMEEIPTPSVLGHPLKVEEQEQVLEEQPPQADPGADVSLV